MLASNTDTLVVITILAVRLIVPLFIPRFPLPAILIALVVDAADQTILQKATDFSLDRYQSFDKALDIYYLAIAYGGKGMNDEAIREAKKAIELKPDYSEALNDLGTRYFNMGQYDRAIEYFNRALANPLYETPSLPLYNMGRAYYQKGDYLMALAKYDEAVVREPNTIILPLIEKDRGIASLKAGYTNKAITHLKKSIEMVPNLVESHYWLGEAYLMVKNRRDAAGEFKTVIRLAPDSDFARMARQKLDRL